MASFTRPVGTSNTLTLSVTDGSGDTAFRTFGINTSNPASPTTTNVSMSGEITNAGLMDITGTAMLSSGAVFNNTATGTVTVETGGLLQLEDSKIYSGTITDNGTVEIVGVSSLSSGPKLNIGTGDQLTIDPAATLILSGATVSGGTINNNGTIDVWGSSAIKVASLNDGSVSIVAGVTLTLDGTTVTGSTLTNLSTTTTAGIINVDGSQTLTLAGSDTITGGVFGTIMFAPQAAGGNSVFFPKVAISDLNPDANPTVTVTIQASSGSFAAISGSGLSITQSGDQVTIVGDLTDVNAALDNGITYTPVGTSNTLTLSVTDGSGDTAFRTIGINTSNPALPTTTNISASGEIANAGLIDITGTATLSSDAVFNSGTVKVETSGFLQLDDSRIYGGTITDNGTVEITGLSSLVNARLNIGTGDQLTIDPTATLFLTGTTINGGTGGTINDGTSLIGATIDVNTSSSSSNSAIDNASLNYGGVTVENGAVLTLDNDTVTGTTFTDTASGALLSIDGGDQLTISGVTINGGTINDGTSLSGATIDVTGNSEIENASLNYGGVTIASGVTLTLDVTLENTTITNSGTLNFTGPSTLDNVSITGGDLTIASGVTVILDDVVLDSVAVTVSSDGATPSIQIDAGQTLTWAGASSFGGPDAIIIDNNGQIIHAGTLSIGFLQVTFEGSGTVTENGGNMGTEPQILINEGNTFDGYGQMGNGTAGWLTLTNQAAGTFNADNSSHPYILDPGSSITNAGTFEATNGGTLEIESTVANDTTILNNTGGSGILQVGANSEVLLSNATVSGGMVSITATGELVATGVSAIDNAIIDNSGSLETGGTFTLDGDTVDGGILTGTGGGGGQNIINVDAAYTLTLNSVTAQGNTDGTGTVDNSGTILLDNTLTLAGTGVTLLFDDTGTVSLNGATIAGANTGETLENNANTISGAGQIGNGNGDLTLQNDANGQTTAQGGTLTIDASVTNNGTMTAASGATLSLTGTVSGTGSTVVDAGGTVVVNALDQQAITYDGVGTLQITPTGNLTGAINGLVQGDVIDFTNNTSITSTSISGSTLTVDESSGGPLTYTIGGATSGEYFAVQSDNNGGTELVLSPDSISVAVSVVGSNNPPVQVGQTLVATASITGDATDVASPIAYQWQALVNGVWTDVSGALAGNFDNGQPSSFLQLTQAELGGQFRVQASFTDDTGQQETVTSAATAAVVPVTPEITLPFTYAIENLTIVKGGSQVYDDSFTEAPPASPKISPAAARPRSCSIRWAASGPRAPSTAIRRRSCRRVAWR